MGDGEPPREDAEPDGAESGSYTARPSKEPPAEQATRDEDQEAKERTGTGRDGRSG